MTYINAFRCQSGVVMSADTQEDWGDYKHYVEKLAVVESQVYPLAIGGAGIADLIEPMIQEVTEKASQTKPATKADLRKLLKDAIETVYRVDLPWLVVKKQDRTVEFLIAAKPTADDFCIFRIKGRRVFDVNKCSIIGYGTPVNFALLERLYRADLSMQQAVMLAIYLVSLSKKLDVGVGGEKTQVVVVTDNGAWIDDPEYIQNSETRVQEFFKLTDELFLDSIDLSMRPSTYSEKLRKFGEDVSQLRDNYSRYTAAHCLNKAFFDPNYKGEPYPKNFPGALITVMGDASVKVREETKEEIERRKQIFAESEELVEEYRKAREKFTSLVAGRTPVYIDTDAKIMLGRRPVSS